MSNMFLTREEVAALTGKTRCDAQGRALHSMGISHLARPDRSVAVLRAHVEQVLGAAAPTRAPTNREPEVQP